MGRQKKDYKKDSRNDNETNKIAQKINKLKDNFDKFSSREKKSQKIQKKLEVETESLRKGQAHLATSVQKLARKTHRVKQQAKAINLENGQIIEKLTTQIDESYVSRSRLNSCENELIAHRKRLERFSEHLGEIATLRNDLENLDARLKRQTESTEANLSLTGVFIPDAARPDTTSETPEQRETTSESPSLSSNAATPRLDLTTADTADEDESVERIMGSPKEIPAVSPGLLSRHEEEQEGAEASAGTPPVAETAPSEQDDRDASAEEQMSVVSARLEQAVTELSEEQVRQEQKTDHLDLLLEQLRTESGVLGDVIDGLDVKLDDTAAQTESLIPQISDLAVDLREVAENTEKQLLARSTELEAAIDRLEEQLAVQKGEFAEGLAGVQQNLDSQHSEISTVRNALRVNQAKEDEAQTLLETGLSAQSVSLTALEEQTQRQQARHNRLVGAFWALSIAILILGGALYWQTQKRLDAVSVQPLAAHSSEAAKIQPSTTASGTTIDEPAFELLRTNMADSQASIDAQSARLTEHQGLIADLSTLIAEQKTLITRQSGRLDEQDEKIESQRSQLSNHEGMINEQAARLSAQDTQTPDRSEELETQSLRFGKIERRIESNEAQLSRLTEQQSLLTTAVERLEKLTAPPVRREVTTAGTRDVALEGADWLAARPGNHYTIQLLGAFEERFVRAAAGTPGLYLPLAHYQRTRDGKSWNILLYGDFKTIESAREALIELPETFREAGAWVRQLSGVQADLGQMR